MIGNREINPLNVLKAREMGHIPNHFSVINLSFRKLPRYEFSVEHSKKIRNWIYKNLMGRFYVKAGNLDKSPKLENINDFEVTVAFEQSSELSFFILACPEAAV